MGQKDCEHVRRRRFLRRGVWHVSPYGSAVVLAVGFSLATLQPAYARDIRSPASRAKHPGPDEANLRVKVESEEGVLIVYDAAVPASDPRPESGYLAY